MKRFLLLLGLTTALACVVQAQKVTWRASKHYNAMVIKFENRNDIDTNTIVMLGNSLTEFGRDWSAKLGVDNVVNYGIMGDNTRGILHRLCQITPHQPKAIFLMIGINDVTQRETAATIFERCRNVIDSIGVQSPQTHLFIQSLLPINQNVRVWKKLINQEEKIIALNSLLSAYCQEQELVFIDLYPLFLDEEGKRLRPELTADGLHVNAEGYRIWGEALQPFLETLHENPVSVE